MYIALLIENSALYAPSIEKIREAIKEFLESMPPRVKVRLILYGYGIEQQPNFMPAQAVTPLLDDINPDDQGDVQLLRAISAGLTALNKVQPGKDKEGKPLPEPRKLDGVLLSDGLNELMDRKSFRRTGDLLRHSNVALFPVAYSPRDDRGPLLNLGELAKAIKRHLPLGAEGREPQKQFQNLSEELRQTPVFTFTAKKFDLDELRVASFWPAVRRAQVADLRVFRRAAEETQSLVAVADRHSAVLGGAVGFGSAGGLHPQAAGGAARHPASGCCADSWPAQGPRGVGRRDLAACRNGRRARVYQPVPILPGGRLYTATPHRHWRRSARRAAHQGRGQPCGSARALSQPGRWRAVRW